MALGIYSGARNVDAKKEVATLATSLLKSKALEAKEVQALNLAGNDQAFRLFRDLNTTGAEAIKKIRAAYMIITGGYEFTAGQTEVDADTVELYYSMYEPPVPSTSTPAKTVVSAAPIPTPPEAVITTTTSTTPVAAKAGNILPTSSSSNSPSLSAVPAKTTGAGMSAATKKGSDVKSSSTLTDEQKFDYLLGFKLKDLDTEDKRKYGLSVDVLKNIFDAKFRTLIQSESHVAAKALILQAESSCVGEVMKNSAVVLMTAKSTLETVSDIKFEVVNKDGEIINSSGEVIGKVASSGAKKSDDMEIKGISADSLLSRSRTKPYSYEQCLIILRDLEDELKASLTASVEGMAALVKTTFDAVKNDKDNTQSLGFIQNLVKALLRAEVVELAKKNDETARAAVKSYITEEKNLANKLLRKKIGAADEPGAVGGFVSELESAWSEARQRLEPSSASPVDAASSAAASISLVESKAPAKTPVVMLDVAGISSVVLRTTKTRTDKAQTLVDIPAQAETLRTKINTRDWRAFDQSKTRPTLTASSAESERKDSVVSTDTVTAKKTTPAKVITSASAKVAATATPAKATTSAPAKAASTAVSAKTVSETTSTLAPKR